MQKISPFLWFDTQAEEAANFYVSVFKNSKLLKVVRNTGATPGPSKVLTVAFEIEGQTFTALNGGPHFTFSEAISFIVNCADEGEVDYYWDALLAGGGKASQCGWLKDRYGVSWQVVPTEFMQLASDPDPAKAKRVMAAMMQMVKLDLPKLREAYKG